MIFLNVNKKTVDPSVVFFYFQILMSNRVVVSNSILLNCFFIEILNDKYFLFRIIRICRTSWFIRCSFDRDLSDSHRKNIISNDVKIIRYPRKIVFAKSYRCAELVSLLDSYFAFVRFDGSFFCSCVMY